MKKIKLFLTIALSVFSLNAFSAQISISKLRINLENGQNSDFLNLQNPSKTEKDSFEIYLQKWTQKDNLGENYESGPTDVLVDSETILVSPKTAVLLPEKDRLVRIIVNDFETAKKDYSYRLFINQLPKVEVEKANNTVSFLFKISLPIFVYSDNIKTFDKMNISKEIKKENDKYFLFIKNNDNQHIQLKDLSWGKDLIKTVNQYLLPGTTTKIKLPDNFENNKQPLNIDSDKGLFILE